MVIAHHMCGRGHRTSYVWAWSSHIICVGVVGVQSAVIMTLGVFESGILKEGPHFFVEHEYFLYSPLLPSK